MAAITSTPGVCGGDPCIAGTRIPVWVIERSRQLGVSLDDMVQDYPSVSREQLLECLIYATEHRAEIEEQIRENEAA